MEKETTRSTAHWATPDILALVRPSLRRQLKLVQYLPALAKMARIGRWDF
jgi:hypothetical protein